MTYSMEERRAYAKGAAKVEERLEYANNLIEILRTNNRELTEANSNLADGLDRWQRQSIENWQAFQAMRDSINEYIPMPSLESDLRHGPEFSINAMTVAECVISYAREHDIGYQWRQTYLYKMAERVLTFLANIRMI